MAQVFTGSDFVNAILEGTLREPIELRGVVKTITGDNTALLFSPNFNCDSWTRIPTSMIESVAVLTLSRCRDHQHPTVTITIKQADRDNVEANVFASLLLSIAQQHDTSVPAQSEATPRDPEKWYIHRSRVQAYSCFCSQTFDEGRNWERLQGSYTTSVLCNDAIRSNRTCTEQQ